MRCREQGALLDLLQTFHTHKHIRSWGHPLEPTNKLGQVESRKCCIFVVQEQQGRNKVPGLSLLGFSAQPFGWPTLSRSAGILPRRHRPSFPLSVSHLLEPSRVPPVLPTPPPSGLPRATFLSPSAPSAIRDLRPPASRAAVVVVSRPHRYTPCARTHSAPCCLQRRSPLSPAATELVDWSPPSKGPRALRIRPFGHPPRGSRRRSRRICRLCPLVGSSRLLAGFSCRISPAEPRVEDKLELMEQNPNHKTNGSSVGTPSCITDPSGNGIPNAIGDCGETPRPRGSNLPKLQEPRDFGICSSFNQDVCGGSRATQPTSSVDSFENGEIDVQQCKGCSNKDHQCSLENGHINNAAGKLFSDLPELQGQCDSRIGLISNQESCVGGQGDKHTSVGDGRENEDMAAGKTLLPLNPQRIPLKKIGVDPRDPDLLLPNLSKVEKVVFTIDMVCRRELFEYNTRIHLTLPTQFCEYNIAFFDLDKESDFKREPQFSKIPDSYWRLDTSMNIISIKVSESDVPYPINIYGTVVARDQVDYRCVYLFKRDRDNPQCITSVDDALTLTGPYRALAGDVMFFEFNLKIIMGDEEAVDQEFSKGLLDRRTVTCESLLLTKSLNSCLSKVKMEFNNIPIALEAYIEVNILNEESYFHGKITAGYKKTGMVLYDSKVAGTETKLGCGGSVSLTRRVVAVPWGNDLVLHFSVPRAKPKSKCIRLEHDEEECTFKLGTYELQVKIVWTGVLTKHRKNVLKEVGRALVLL